MQPTVHFGFSIPIEELPIPVGLYLQLSLPVQRAFLTCLSMGISTYMDARQRVDSDNPVQVAMGSMRSMIQLAAKRHELAAIDHLLIIVPLIFQTIEDQLTQYPERASLVNTIIPLVEYECDRSVAVTWST